MTATDLYWKHVEFKERLMESSIMRAQIEAERLLRLRLRRRDKLTQYVVLPDREEVERWKIR